MTIKDKTAPKKGTWKDFNGLYKYIFYELHCDGFLCS